MWHSHLSVDVGALQAGLNTAQELLTSEHNGVEGVLKLAAGVGLSLGSAASGHWARDALCAAVGVIGASIWIGLWSRLARYVQWARAIGALAAVRMRGLAVRSDCALAPVSAPVRVRARIRGHVSLDLHGGRDGHVDPKVSRKLVHCGRHARPHAPAQALAPDPSSLFLSLSSPPFFSLCGLSLRFCPSAAPFCLRLFDLSFRARERARGCSPVERGTDGKKKGREVSRARRPVTRGVAAPPASSARRCSWSCGRSSPPTPPLGWWRPW